KNVLENVMFSVLAYSRESPRKMLQSVAKRAFGYRSGLGDRTGAFPAFGCPVDKAESCDCESMASDPRFFFVMSASTHLIPRTTSSHFSIMRRITQ
ncbi:MAG: hypothetical protein ACLTS6_13145, partial [Anaerobutyricum sp.]